MESSIPSSPIAVVGTIALLLAYVVAAGTAVVGIAGNARQRPRLVRASVSCTLIVMMKR